MTLMRWDPFRDAMAFQSRFNRLMSDALPRDTDDTFGTWAPAVDIFERGDDLVIRAELPGVARDEIDIQLDKDTLVLSGERRRDSEVEKDKAYRMERVYGAFARSFRLPTTVDSAGIKAVHRDGVLEIVLPKLEQARSRKVQIEAA